MQTGLTTPTHVTLKCLFFFFLNFVYTTPGFHCAGRFLSLFTFPIYSFSLLPSDLNLSQRPRTCFPAAFWSLRLFRCFYKHAGVTLPAHVRRSLRWCRRGPAGLYGEGMQKPRGTYLFCRVAQRVVLHFLGVTRPICQLMGTNALRSGWWGCTSFIYKPFTFSSGSLSHFPFGV